MSEQVPTSDARLDEDDVTAVFGGGDEPQADYLSFTQRRRVFEAWHHPVKQIVRERQWAELTRRLLGDLGQLPSVLRLFTLPGPDFLDVRVLAEACAERGIPVEVFGFDSTVQDMPAQGTSHTADEAAAADAQAALRQAGRITAESLVLRGRLEDIAYPGTHAATQLRAQQPFHVVNIDACSHFTSRTAGQKNLFDALMVLFEHQLRCDKQWLLFITTRCAPDRLSDAGEEFKRRIAENLELSPDGFGSALAAALESEVTELEAVLEAAWKETGLRFLKAYIIGLGKYLLHLCNGQPGSPADVELASSYAYSIHPDETPMIALAFRIIPARRVIFPPSVGGVVPVRPLEPQLAIKVAEKATRLWVLDDALEDAELRRSAVDGTIALLRSANYDVPAWSKWVADHPTRPVDLTGTDAAA